MKINPNFSFHDGEKETERGRNIEKLLSKKRLKEWYMKIITFLAQ